MYEALKKALPKGWHCWHSLRIRVPGHLIDVEADFVIADPARGILILEVKGGRIEEHDGRWYTNGQELKQAPREQANRFLHELLARLRRDNVDVPPCGIATCFPDTPFSDEPTQGNMTGCVLGQQDLRWLDETLPDVMQRAIPEGYIPKKKWLDAIHKLWGYTWAPRMDFGLRVRLEKEERIRLDEEQFSVLQGLMENDSVLVTGAAGTGKTILALSLARKLAAEGKQVLMLCYTDALAGWLASQAGGANLAVHAIKRYAVDLLGQCGREVAVEDTPEFWRRITLEAAVDAVPSLDLPWDALVVDESQDLSEEDWLLIEELSRGQALWGFWDPDQAFWKDRKVHEDLFKTRYRLQKRYRCPSAIQCLVGHYLRNEVKVADVRDGRDQNVIGVRPCPGPGVVPDKIGVEIENMLGSGLDAADIAVLSLRGAGEPESIVHRERLGGHRVVRADSPEANSNVVVETFLRFKGLERPAIIVTDVGLAAGKPDYAKRMYIALTRALSSVRIVDTRDSLAQDPILVRFLQAH